MRTPPFLKAAGVILPILGIGLHGYINLVQAEGGLGAFTLGLLALSSLPYVACLLVSLLGKGRSLMGACGAVLPLASDLSVYYAVFIEPTSSTAALSLLVAPFLNLLLWVPLGLLAGYLAGRWFARKG